MSDPDPRPADNPLPAGSPYSYLDERIDEVPLEAIALPERPQPSNKWWVLLACVVYLAVTQGLMGVIAYVLYAIESGDFIPRDPDFVKSPEFANALGPAILVAQISGIIGSWITLRAVHGRQWGRKVALRLPSWQHTILVLLGFPGMYMLAMGIAIVARFVLERIFGTDNVFNMEDMARIFQSFPLPLALLAVALGPGLAEELFCRAFLGYGIIGNRGYIRGAVITSLIFGLLHILPGQVVYTAFIGLVLHIAYLLTRSLWIPILLHTVNNGSSMLLLHMPKEFQEIGDKKPIPPYIFLGAAVLLAAVAWVLYQTRARLVSTSPDMPAWQPDFPSVEYPPPGSGTVVVRPRPAMLHWAVALAGVLVFLSAVALAAQ